MNWDRVDKSAGENSCWPWTGPLNAYGYGNAGHGKKAHREAYESAIGPIPRGLSVLHRCDNRPCCNPSHLFVGTQADNMNDMWSKGRGKPAPGGAFHGTANAAAKLTTEQVIQLRLEISAKNTTQRALAAKYGISEAQVSQIKHGKKRSIS